MEIVKVMNSAFTQYHSPLNFNVKEMNINLLLMCKLLFILLVVHGFVFYINDPHIPFIRWLDWFNQYPNVFKNVFRSLFLISGTLLVFNVRVRLMAIILGLSVITALLSSKPSFRNHLFICGCAFFLAGLTNKNDKPWLIYIQISLIYFGAVINKVLQLDWWNGQFMFNWLYYAMENKPFIKMTEYVSGIWLAKLMSWASMLIEILIAIFLLNKKTHKLAVWIMIFFHSILYVMTVFRFGHFYEDLVIMLIVFVNWPQEKIKLNASFSIFKKFEEFGLLSNFSVNIVDQPKHFLSLKVADSIFYNWHALRKLLLYNPLFYLFLFGMDLLIRILFNGYWMHFFHIGITLLFMFFFLPLIWKKPVVMSEVNQ